MKAFGLQPKEHLDWGSGHLAVPAGQPAIASMATYLGSSNKARQTFGVTGTLPAVDDNGIHVGVPACRGAAERVGVCSCAVPQQGDWTTMAVAFNLKTVGSRPVISAGLVLAMDDGGSTVRYFGAVMPEYWRKNGTTFGTLLDNACTEHAANVDAGAVQDAELSEVFERAGGQSYAKVSALTFRQVFGDNSIVWYDGKVGGFGNATSKGNKKTPASAMMFVKGLGSSGDTGTIDDNYPAALLYLWSQPELLNALLRPINMFMSNETYSRAAAAGFPRNFSFTDLYSVHYLGQYPVAEMQCWRGNGKCEPMPLEMTADNVQMIVAAAFATNDTSTAELYMPLMAQFAQYLAENGLRPTKQLCSDDFEGPSAGNANLAAKSIIALGAYAQLCHVVGNSADHAKYMSLARQYAEEWAVLSAGGRNGASVRDYNASGTWSLKYNLVWDKVFGLGLFEEAIETECKFIMADDSPVRQPYGWYLDDRSETDGRHLTNAGWSEWAAAMCGKEAVEDLYFRHERFALETPDRMSFTDYYNALTGARLGFEGRAQMGGFGATLVLDKWPNGIGPTVDL